LKKNLRILLLILMCTAILTVISFPINNTTKNLSIKDSNSKIERENQTQVEELKLAGKTSTISHNLSRVWNEVSNSSGSDSKNARIAIDSMNNVHIVWEEEVGSDTDILYRIFNYTTSKFGPIYNVSDPGILYDGNNSAKPDICIDSSDNVYITWVEPISGLAGNIYYNYYTKATKTWNGPIPVAKTGNDELQPSIACDNSGNVGIVYRTYFGIPILNFKLNASFYDGNSWTHTAVQRKDNNDNQEKGDIFWYGGSWHLVYINYTTDPLYSVIYKTKTGTNPWSTGKIIRNSGADISSDPELTIKNNQIYVSWQERIGGGNFHIMSKNKTIAAAWSSASGPYDLSGDTGSTDGWKIFSISQNNNGDLIVAYQNQSEGITYIKKTGDNVDYKGLMAIGANSLYPSLAVNEFGSAYCTWYRGATPEIYMRKLDVYGPQLAVYTLKNNTAYKGIINLNSSVHMVDIQLINYSFYIDTNRDGLANDIGSKWQEIHSWKKGDLLNQFNSTWNTTNWLGKRLDLPCILISVKAIDENFLDEEIIFGNITIDNYIPQRSNFINIYDDVGHNYVLNNNSNFTFYGGGNIHFVFNGYDNNTGSGTYVYLYNESITRNIKLKTNSTNNEIVFNAGLIDGIYNFYINVSDNAGNWNKSITFYNIRIDNTIPLINITDPIVNDEISDGKVIHITSPSNDILFVNYSYYITNPNNQTFIGSAFYPGNSWTFIFNVPTLVYANITLVVNATDYAGLNGWDTVRIYVDNQAPTPVLEIDVDSIGFSPEFIVRYNNDHTDNDIQHTSVWYRRQGTGNYALGQKIYLTDINRTLVSNATHYLITYDKVDLSEVPYDWNELQIQIRATDNQNLEGILLLNNIKIIKTYPNKTKEFKAEISGYTITLSWERVPSAKNYLIYKSLIPFDVEKINSMTPYTRLNYLGKKQGDKFCIAKLNASQRYYIDEVLGPNVYYYLLVSVNTFGNPSPVSSKSVEVSIENTDKGIQPNQTRFWMYYFIGYVGAMIGLTFYGIHRIKRKFFKVRVKVEREAITEEEFVSFEKEGLDLEAKVAVEESAILATPVREKPMYASFEEVKEEPKTTIDKCPTCGWILSSTAKKCPRCGWKRL